MPRLGAFLGVSRMDGGGTATSSHPAGDPPVALSVPDLLTHGAPGQVASWGTEGPNQHPSAPAEQLGEPMKGSSPASSPA